MVSPAGGVTTLALALKEGTLVQRLRIDISCVVDAANELVEALLAVVGRHRLSRSKLHDTAAVKPPTSFHFNRAVEGGMVAKIKRFNGRRADVV